MSHEHKGHNYIGLNHMSHEHKAHNYLGDNHMSHEHKGHNYTGNHHIGHKYGNGVAYCAATERLAYIRQSECMSCTHHGKKN